MRFVIDQSSSSNKRPLEHANSAAAVENTNEAVKRRRHSGRIREPEQDMVGYSVLVRCCYVVTYLLDYIYLRVFVRVADKNTQLSMTAVQMMMIGYKQQQQAATITHHQQNRPLSTLLLLLLLNVLLHVHQWYVCMLLMFMSIMYQCMSNQCNVHSM